VESTPIFQNYIYVTVKVLNQSKCKFLWNIPRFLVHNTSSHGPINFKFRLSLGFINLHHIPKFQLHWLDRESGRGCEWSINDPPNSSRPLSDLLSSQWSWNLDTWWRLMKTRGKQNLKLIGPWEEELWSENLGIFYKNLHFDGNICWMVMAYKYLESALFEIIGLQSEEKRKTYRLYLYLGSICNIEWFHTLQYAFLISKKTEL